MITWRASQRAVTGASKATPGPRRRKMRHRNPRATKIMEGGDKIYMVNKCVDV